jgi:hypothetical protein
MKKKKRIGYRKNIPYRNTFLIQENGGYIITEDGHRIRIRKP